MQPQTIRSKVIQDFHKKKWHMTLSTEKLLGKPFLSHQAWSPSNTIMPHKNIFYMSLKIASSLLVSIPTHLPLILSSLFAYAIFLFQPSTPSLMPFFFPIFETPQKKVIAWQLKSKLKNKIQMDDCLSVDKCWNMSQIPTEVDVEAYNLVKAEINRSSQVLTVFLWCLES